MSLREEVRSRLGPLLERGLDPPPDWDAGLARYLELLRERNRVVNLVSRRTQDDWVERHLLPCLAALLVVPTRTIVRVLDVGSGGGLPGIPLKILRPDVRLDLVDATGKKVEFLSDCLRELGLSDAVAHWCRIERPTPELEARGPFDAAFARAVGSEAEIARATRPLLASPQGRLWWFVSPDKAAGGPVWSDVDGRPITALRAMERSRGPAG